MNECQWIWLRGHSYIQSSMTPSFLTAPYYTHFCETTPHTLKPVTVTNVFRTIHDRICEWTPIFFCQHWSCNKKTFIKFDKTHPSQCYDKNIRTLLKSEWLSSIQEKSVRSDDNRRRSLRDECQLLNWVPFDKISHSFSLRQGTCVHFPKNAMKFVFKLLFYQKH